MSIAILGATGSIGSSLARMLSASGHSLILLGRNEEKLAQLSQETSQPFAVVDMSSSQNLIVAISTSMNTAERLTGIVNCIGSLWLKPIQFTSDEDFRTVVDTNLFTAFATIKAAAKLMRENGGSVVLLSSAAAEIGLHHHESIGAAKAGIIGLARSAAASLSNYNVRVNCVCPGMTRTEMTRQIWENPTSEKATQEMHALGRIGEPAHIASMIQFLLDPANDWITGQAIAVDGGLSTIQPRRRMSV